MSSAEELRAEAQSEIEHAPENGAKEAEAAKAKGVPEVVAEAQGEAETIAEEIAGSARMAAAAVKEALSSGSADKAAK